MIIEFQRSINQEKWVKQVSSNKLKETFGSLAQNYPLIKEFPKLVFYWQWSHDRNIEIFLVEIGKYLQDMLSLSHVFNCKEMIKLFNLDQMTQKKVIQKETIKSLDNYSYCVSQMIYIEELDVIFVSGIKNNYGLRGLIKYRQNDGQLIVYRYMNNQQKYTVAFIQQFTYGITHLTFDQEYNYLTLCFSNGIINIYDFSNCVLEVVASLNPHQNQRAVFTFINYFKGYLYSAIDKSPIITVSDINTHKSISSIQLTNKPITSLMKLPYNDMLIGTEESGRLIIAEIREELHIEILGSEGSKYAHMKLIGIESNQSLVEKYLIFIANTEIMEMYTINPNTNALIKRLEIPLNGFQPSSILYDYKESLLLIGNDKGSIQAWSHSTISPEYSLPISSSPIKGIGFNSRKRLILTYGDNDTFLSLIPISSQCNSEVCRINQLMNAEYIIPNSIEPISSIEIIRSSFNPKEVICSEKEFNEIEEDDCSTMNIKSSEETERNTSDDFLEVYNDDSDSSSLDGWNTETN